MEQATCTRHKCTAVPLCQPDKHLCTHFDSLIYHCLSSTPLPIFVIRLYCYLELSIVNDTEKATNFLLKPILMGIIPAMEGFQVLGMYKKSQCFSGI